MAKMTVKDINEREMSLWASLIGSPGAKEQFIRGYKLLYPYGTPGGWAQAGNKYDYLKEHSKEVAKYLQKEHTKAALASEPRKATTKVICNGKKMDFTDANITTQARYASKYIVSQFLGLGQDPPRDIMEWFKRNVIETSGYLVDTEDLINEIKKPKQQKAIKTHPFIFIDTSGHDESLTMYLSKVPLKLPEEFSRITLSQLEKEYSKEKNQRVIRKQKNK